MRKTIIIILLVYTSGLFAQDIIVKKDGSRILSKVTKITEDTIFCFSKDNFNNPSFYLIKNDISKIILEIGSVYNFDESNNTDEVSTYHNTKKLENVNPISVITHEIGAGITGAIISSSKFTNTNSPFQLNYRLLKQSKKSDLRQLGININYSSKIMLFNNAQRFSCHMVYQEQFKFSSTINFYLNAMIGLGYYMTKENYNEYTYTNNEYLVIEKSRNKYLLLPSIHLGIGGKYAINSNSGVFCEAGLGGCYFLNAGYYFR
jgi:hypothetical protein